MKTILNHLSVKDLIGEFNKIETDTLVVIVDHVVWTHFSKELLLENIENKKVIFWKSPDGEKVKNLNDYQNAIEFIIEKGVHRSAHLLAIGGGAVTDFAGFIAATLLRGIAWSVVPTTLLGMVDSSIGGKVAINSKSGKNLIGAFHQPTQVYICSEFLETLPEVEKMSGLGETLKYCFLDYTIYDHAIKKEPLDKIIKLCAEFKLKITEEDFLEHSQRKILNLGHSFGHAIEFIYNIPHGLSVIWGMSLVFKLWGTEKNLNDLKTLVTALGLQLEHSPWLNKEFPIEKIMTYLNKDKKVSALSAIDVVVVKDIGNAEVETRTFVEIQERLEVNKDELKKFTL